MHLSQHVLRRVKERSLLGARDLRSIIRQEKYITLGRDQKGNAHKLFYSHKDDMCFIIVHDENDDALITMLPIDYHEKMAWNIDHDLCQRVKSNCYHDTTYDVVSRLTPPDQMRRLHVVYETWGERKKLGNIEYVQLVAWGYNYPLCHGDPLNDFLCNSHEIKVWCREKMKERGIQEEEYAGFLFHIGAKGELFSVS